MKDKIFGVLQRVGRSFMLPIAILPVAGLLLGIGGSFTNQQMLTTYGLTKIMGQGTILNMLFSLMSEAGNVIFANLPLIFAVGVAIGMAKQEKAVAALSSVVAFLIMHTVISTILQLTGQVTIDGNTVIYGENVLSGSITSVLGIQSLQMGVFGGIIVGLGVAALHNRFYRIELPQVLSFFGGTRFVPIISALVYFLVGILMYFIWPTIQTGIYSLGGLIQNSGYAGTWVYGFIERALIPFGLHHVFYLPFWQTGVGGTLEVAGKVVEGAQNIFFAQLADPNTTQFAVSATRFMSGKFPLMIFGLPGAALAMYHCADSKNKKVAGGLLLSAALTSMLTGITEPIEFTFLFVAPVLYIIHCVFAGAAYMFMHIFNVGVGMTFSGGLIDLTLFGILQGNSKTNWIWVVIVGIVYFIVYYLLFSFIIRKWDLKTPGRGESEEVKLYTRSDVNAKKNEKADKEGYDEQSVMIAEGLGGKDNISDVDCCATRLRTTVKDAGKVKKDILKQSGAAGVIVKGNGVQVIYGPQVAVIKSKLDLYMSSGEEETISSNSVEVSESAVEETEPAKVETGKKVEVYAPLIGKAVPLQEVGDGVFSEEMIGKGMAIEPEEGNVYAPFDGEVSMIFDTKHAIGLTSPEGVELMIHVGIDTVKLGGKYYDIKVETGDKVKRGQLLAEFDKEGIAAEGYPLITPVVVGNTGDCKSVVFTNTEKADLDTVVLEVEK
ncbi:MAG: glucose PTS transporter subunit IIA [Lachnospiraceae bacterium]|nr:glucose PTS transporter subunit IIA [Lachnospiraceae bacterium]